MSAISYHHKSKHTETPDTQGCPSGWIWFSAGILFGLFLAFLLYLRTLNHQSDTTKLTKPDLNSNPIISVAPKSIPKVVTNDSQNFKFYDLDANQIPPESPQESPFNKHPDLTLELTPEIINRPAQERPKPKPKPKPPIHHSVPHSDEIVLELPLPPANKPSKAPAPSPLEPEPGLIVQIGAFRDPRDAELLRQELKLLGFPAQTQTATVNDRKWYRIRLPAAANSKIANQQQQRLSQAGYGSIRVH